MQHQEVREITEDFNQVLCAQITTDKEEPKSKTTNKRLKFKCPRKKSGRPRAEKSPRSAYKIVHDMKTVLFDYHKGI